MPESPGKSEKNLEGLPFISPDVAEEERGIVFDDILSARSYHRQPIVGLGGSAGSIDALQQFFSAMDVNSGMAFIVVLHLLSERESTLTSLIQRCTSMPVHEAEDGHAIKPNHIYVIPPGKHLVMTDGHVRLKELTHERGKRVAIDLFLRTLADTHGPNAVAIILSGRDADGSIGIKRIKERGGLSIVQQPADAAIPEMPVSAIGTGMVDWVLPAGEIPARLLDYHRRERRITLPPEDGPEPSSIQAAQAASETELQEVLIFLRARTGRDFSNYKRATIVRRVGRRMRVNSIENLGEYLMFLRTHPGEAGALLQDLLISVTNFFRDRTAFAELEKKIPELFVGKGVNDSVRVWVPGCATGEEAYSIGMMLFEHAAQITAPPSIQIFATDLDGQAIRTAREGLYPDTIQADVSEERLRRFFTREHGGFRIKRELRESILFALHDLLRDSPFSRLELISCRNLLIYLNREAQSRVFMIFHFALKTDGKLFLGLSDSVEDGSPLFAVIDKKMRLYSPKPGARTGLPVPLRQALVQLPHEMTVPPKDIDITLPNWLPSSISGNASADEEADKRRPFSWSELHFKLIDYFSPPSLIVNGDYEIMHLSENAREFLQFSGGEPSRNLLKVVHPGLRIELRAVLYRAAKSQTVTETGKRVIDLDGKSTVLNIRVSPAPKIAADFLLVVFEESAGLEDAAELKPKPVEENWATRQLESELESVKANLREVVEKYETSTEEFKASNEELQAMNEELRSATEELETSREELQSINEELTTVNLELKNNVDQLANANSDLHNLMSATAIATVFLDRNQRITRFTPPAVDLFNFIPTDSGRPLADLRHHLDYPELTADANKVLTQLVPVEREVSHAGKKWYLARLLPYRTVDDHIGGVVLTFIDITERKQGEEQLRAFSERARRTIEVDTVGIVFFDGSGKVTEANDAFLRMSGNSKSDLSTGKLRVDQIPALGGVPADLIAIDNARKEGRSTTFEAECLRKDGSRWQGTMGLARLSADEGILYMLDVTENHHRQEALRGSQEKLQTLFSLVPAGIYTCDAEGRIDYFNQSAVKLWGEVPSGEQRFGGFKKVWQNGDWVTPEKMVIAKAIHSGVALSYSESIVENNVGKRVVISENIAPILSPGGKVVGAINVFVDVTHWKEVENALTEAKAKLEDVNKDLEGKIVERTGRLNETLAELETFSYTIAHDMRSPLRAMRGYAGMLLEEKGALLDDTGRDYLTRIKNSSVRLDRLITDVLTYSQIVRQELVMEPVHLTELMAQILESYPNLQSPAAEISVQNPLPVVKANPAALTQVFSNLLNNAAKFVKAGELPMVKVRAETDPEKKIARIWIEDKGIGMAAASQARIFDLFRQVNPGKYEGSGVGLAIVRKAVERMDAKIGVESELGQGSRFWVELKLAD